MSTQFQTDIDLTKKELRNAAIQNLSADPSSPSTGQIYFNTTDKKLKQYDGTGWIEYSTATSSGDASTNTATSVDSEIALFSSTTGKLLKRATQTGILKATSGVIGTATSGTDFAPATSGSGILKGNGSGGTSTATAGTDYSAGTSALGTGILKSTTTTGALTIAVAGDFPTLNQNTSGTAANLSGTPALPNGTTATTQTAGDSTTKLATTAFVTTAVGAVLGANDAMVYKGVIDASANPNYPAANAGDTYKISVAGKIGGASGTNVEVGDMAICLVDSTAAGNQATVGANWDIIQVNIDGAVTGPASSTSGNIATFNGTGGKVIQDSGKAAPTGTIVGTSDTQTLTNKDLTSSNTFPTFNQNTTGSAAKLTTARTINGTSFDGTANITVPGNSTTATYGDGSTTAFAITHGLASSWPLVQLFEVSTGNMIIADVQRTSSTVVTITHSVAPTTNQFRYVMFG